MSVLSRYCGWNKLALTGPLDPANMTDMSELMSRFYGGETSSIIVRISNHTAIAPPSPPPSDDDNMSADDGGGADDGDDGSDTLSGIYSPASTLPLYAEAIQGAPRYR